MEHFSSIQTLFSDTPNMSSWPRGWKKDPSKGSWRGPWHCLGHLTRIRNNHPLASSSQNPPVAILGGETNLFDLKEHLPLETCAALPSIRSTYWLMMGCSTIKDPAQFSRSSPISSLKTSCAEVGMSRVLSVYVCMHVCMSVCLYVCMSACLHVCMSGCLDVCMSVCLYVCMSVCLYVCLYVCMSVCLSVCMYVCTYVSMRVHEYMSILVYEYTSIWTVYEYILFIYWFMFFFTARTGVLPGEVDVNCAGPMFFACWYAGEHGNLADETCFQSTKP